MICRFKLTYWKLFLLFLCSSLTKNHFLHGCNGRRAFVATSKPTWKTTTNFMGGSTQSGSKGKTDGGGGGDGTALEGKSSRQQIDRFVQAAPLIVAVVCHDGVLVVAAHTSDHDEPLLFFSHVDHDPAARVPTEESVPSQRTDDADDNHHPTPGFYRDLPLDYAGPFRIQAVDRFGTTLACTGWRADCDALVHRAKALSAGEALQFGPPAPPPPVSTDRRPTSSRRLLGGGSSLGFVVSKELSLHLAKCATSESTRTRSCAGLLATPGGGLWLVDATGAYSVRALCVGGGFTANDDTDSFSTHRVVSELVNQRLLEVDWTQLDGTTALRRLLLLLEKSCGNDNTSPSSKVSTHSPLLCQGTRLEACFVSPSNPPMARLLMKNDTTKPLATMQEMQ